MDRSEGKWAAARRLPHYSGRPRKGDDEEVPREWRPPKSLDAVAQASLWFHSEVSGERTGISGRRGEEVERAAPSLTAPDGAPMRSSVVERRHSRKIARKTKEKHVKTSLRSTPWIGDVDRWKRRSKMKENVLFLHRFRRCCNYHSLEAPTYLSVISPLLFITKVIHFWGFLII
jgi:hypothetical protein